MPRKSPRPSIALALALTLPMNAALPLAGCTEMPDLDGAISRQARNAPYPAILPLEALDLPASGETGAALAEAARLAARAHALRMRAAAIRRAIIDEATRKRMEAAVARHWGKARRP